MLHALGSASELGSEGVGVSLGGLVLEGVLIVLVVPLVVHHFLIIMIIIMVAFVICIFEL
jgi:hypothetical protein